jgi:hypothetical protein
VGYGGCCAILILGGENMADGNDLKEKRKRAYATIKLLFEGVNGVNWINADLREDNALALYLDISPEKLALLKEGEIDPPVELVDGIKAFFREHANISPIMDKIENDLIEPFK